MEERFTVQGHISGNAYRKKMEELMGKVYSASTDHIRGASYGENGGANGEAEEYKWLNEREA